MPINKTLNGHVGQPARFGGDYLFRNESLPDNMTVYSGEHTLNNTLGRLKLSGEIDTNLPLVAGNILSIVLQYQESDEWKDFATLVSLSGASTLPAGTVFEYIPPPSDTKRIYRLSITTNFNASDVNLTSAIDILPLA